MRSLQAVILILMQHLCSTSHALPCTSTQETPDGGHVGQQCDLSTPHKVPCKNQIEHPLQIRGKEHVLKLTKTRDLLVKNFTVTHYGDNGELIVDSPGHLAHCCYTGSVNGVVGSLASVCIHNEISGYVTMNDEMYSIDPDPSSDSSKLKVTVLRRRPPHHQEKRSLYFTDTKGQKENYRIELFLVADKQEFQRHGEDLERTRQRLISVAHHLNQIFSRINFQVFLVGVEIWTRENQAVISESAHTTLHRFLHWRGEELLPRRHHDNAQLISGERFKNHALGEAFLGKMCSDSQSGGIIKDTGLSARELAMYVAHEMGHNLGMSHDTEDCYCPARRGKCLLSRRTGHNMNDMFSDCSHRFLHRFLEERDVSCLKDHPQIYIDEPMLLHSHSYDNESLLEAVGVVSTILCLVVFLLVLVIFCLSKICLRKRGKIVKTTFPS